VRPLEVEVVRDAALVLLALLAILVVLPALIHLAAAAT
jgi:hypothetical protein